MVSHLYRVTGDIVSGAFSTLVNASSPEEAQRKVEALHVTELDGVSADEDFARVDSVDVEEW